MTIKRDVGDDLMEMLSPPLVSIPTAGRALGLSEETAYVAANSGQIPTLLLGKRRKVPTAALKRMLGLEPA